MQNPMTASGDTIYGGASGAPTRLAKGSDGEVLKLSGGVPTWDTDTDTVFDGDLAANTLTDSTQDIQVGKAFEFADGLTAPHLTIVAPAADADGDDLEITAPDGGAHTSNDPDGGDIILTPGAAGSGGAGSAGVIKMAGVDLIPYVDVSASQGPSASRATYGTVAGGSTPAESKLVALFGASSAEYLDFYLTLPISYGGSGMTVKLKWTIGELSTTARWEAAIRRLQDDAEDFDTAHTYDFNGISAAAPSVLREVDYATISFTDGADMDSLAAGEAFVLRLRRDPTHGDDDATIDAELWGFTVGV